jgi:hypothetical protein
MHVLCNDKGELFAGLDYRNWAYEAAWTDPSSSGKVEIQPASAWPETIRRIEANFGIKLEGTVIRLIEVE